ncbi:MAG: hypothetical protein ACR2LF_02870 [Jatrophihabitantaceae bacterium]
MGGHPDEIDQALTTLSATVADRLSAAGWSRRVLDGDRTDATLTRSTQNGVIDVIEIHRTSFQWPDDWPVEVETSLGVGYEPALNLMPLLTVHLRAALIDDPEHGRTNSFTVQLTGRDDVDQAAQRIVQFANDHASAYAEHFPDAAAIDGHLRCEVETAQARSEDEGDDEDGDPSASDFDTQLRLVVLAAMGRHEETRVLLATYPAEQTDRTIDRDDRRFIRQLTRWLDAGGPVAPPIEETLAQLPRRARPPRPSWSNARAESKAKKEALDAARAKFKGKTLDQLKQLIADEYSARGIEIAPSVVDFNAEMLQTEQQPFGRARTALKAIRMLKSSGGDMIRLIKHASDDDPEWLQPPDRAAYPMIADRNRYTPVQLDAAANDLLERVRTEGPRRMGPWVLIDVWLAREDPIGPLVASIGAHRVGTIPETHANEFDSAMRAATLFDEDPFVRGRLTAADGTGAIVLEISLPERQGVDSST